MSSEVRVRAELLCRCGSVTLLFEAGNTPEDKALLNGMGSRPPSRHCPRCHAPFATIRSTCRSAGRPAVTFHDTLESATRKHNLRWSD